jgi:4a-hydroxytetrahydrobiopterin dehydratase
VRELLGPDAIDDHLARLPGWTRDGDVLRRSYTFPAFGIVISAVDQIATHAELLDHHPDLDIRWRTLHVALSTHSAGGITGLDVELAQRIHRIAGELFGA